MQSSTLIARAKKLKATASVELFGSSMKLVRTTRNSPWLMNFIPLADIAFLLLIFFLLGSSFVLQSGIRVEVPFSPFLLAPLESPEIISITPPPHSKIYYDNRNYSIDGLAARLEDGVDGTTVVVKADAESSYQLVTRITALCLQNGLSVVLATNPEAKPLVMEENDVPLAPIPADE